MKLCRAIGVIAALATLAFRAAAKSAHRATTPLLLRLAADQRRIWSFPAAAVSGTGRKPAMGVVGATAALIALDPIVTPVLQQSAFQDTPAVRRINHMLSGRHTAIAINAVWSLCWIGGLIRRNAYAGRTGLLAGEAALDAQIVAITMKHADRRMRPIEVGTSGDFARTWLRTKNRNIDGAGCFPSGHTASAFAVAAVFAERCPRQRRVAIAAYGLAGLVAVSRLTSRAHFPSDVFFGAVLGCSISRFVVLKR